MPSYSAYFTDLGMLLGQTEVTDRQNTSRELDAGLEEATSLILERVRSKGGTLMFIGNGGSASIASHMAVDFWKAGGLRAVCFNDGSQLTCLGNDFGYEHVFEKPIQMFGREEDVLVAISSSGRSENILRGVYAANQMGCKVITCSGFSPDNPLRREGDLNFYVSSNSYGYVEITHLSICHALLDLMPAAG